MPIRGACDVTSKAVDHSQGNYWRICSASDENLVRAMDSGTWGAESETVLQRVSNGDSIALYLSLASPGRRRVRGFWGTAIATRPLYKARSRIWDNGVFPHRIDFKVIHRCRSAPFPPELVLQALNQPRLTYHQPKSLMRLTEQEFTVIERGVIRMMEIEALVH
jgi:hypothetical protein